MLLGFRARGFPRVLAEVTGRSTMPPRWGWSSQRGIINVTLGLPAALARPLGPSPVASGVDDGPGIVWILVMRGIFLAARSAERLLP